MPHYDKDVEVSVDSSVRIEIYCENCGEELKFRADAKAGFRVTDCISIYIEPHKCKPEE